MPGLIEPFSSGSVQGFLHRPASPPAAGLVLTHGAGANCESPLLLAAANAFAEAGICVLRFDLPFRRRKRFGPPSPATSAEDRNALRDAARQLRSRLSLPMSLPIWIGGHSYGGRQATILAAEDPAVADRLLLFSYPLHPPNKPAQSRTGHFATLHTPALFIHGTNDPFGTMEELRAALTLIPAPTDLIPVEKAGHDLRKGKFDVAALAVKPLLAQTPGLT